MPLVGARVQARWLAVGLDGEEGRTEVRTDTKGRFTLCGIPVSVRLSVSARVGSWPGPEQAVRVSGRDGEPGELHILAPLEDPRRPASSVGWWPGKGGGLVQGAVTMDARCS